MDNESDTRRKLGVLTHLEITDDTTSLRERVVAVEREVHVGLRTSGNHHSTEHLDQTLDIGNEASDGIDGNDERQEDGANDEGDDETPPWKLRARGVDGSHSHSEAAKEDRAVPPHGDFGVSLHESTMRVDVFTVAFLPDDFDDFLSVPEENVSNGCTNGQVGTELVENLSRGEPRESNCFKLGLIETQVVIENEELIVSGTILVEERLGEEGEVLSTPSVGSVGRTEGDTIT